VSFFDSARFANWLHNGQGSADTETGAYTLLGGTAFPSNGLTVTRNAEANIFLTSKDEWYKAAYYDTSSLSYYDYPAGTDTKIVCASPGATANTANCFNAAGGGPTDVGSYTDSPSPNGTFDQGANLWEWNGPDVSGGGYLLRGGAYSHNSYAVAASYLVGGSSSSESNNIGFRVASLVPASPPVPSLSPFGITLLLSVLGFAGYRKLHA
jgi:hypothetical protein